MSAPVATAPPRTEAVHICGIATSGWRPEHDAVLDELAFDCVDRALRDAGLRKHEVQFTALASMDVYDGRSISSGLTTPAAGGYLADAYRIEGDAGQAIIAASQAIRAGADVAVAVAVHHPEIRHTSPAGHRAFLDQASNLAFEPQFNRPVGMSATAALALHATAWLERNGGGVERLASIAAREITCGAKGAAAGRRDPVEAADVLASPAVAWPLTELMLPAHTSGAAAIVLASAPRARRARSRARILGSGMSSGDWAWSGSWLNAPADATAHAADTARARAGVSQVDVVELTAASPALVEPLEGALGVGLEADAAVISPSGGVRSNHPGLANGALRLSAAIDWLERREGGGRGLVHSTDLVTGPVGETATVLVVEVD